MSPAEAAARLGPLSDEQVARVVALLAAAKQPDTVEGGGRA